MRPRLRGRRRRGASAPGGPPVASLCSVYGCGWQTVWVYGGGEGGAAFGQSAMDITYGSGVFGVAFNAAEATPLPTIYVTASWQDWMPYTISCLWDSCKLQSSITMGMSGDGWNAADQAAAYTIPTIQLLGGQVKSYQETGVPIPVAPVQTQCAIPMELRDTVTGQHEKAVAAIAFLLPVGYNKFTAKWELELADGGSYFFETQANFSEPRLTYPGRSGNGVARPMAACP